MEIIRGEIYRVLKPEGKAVFKTGESYYQWALVPTPKFLMLSEERTGFKKLYIRQHNPLPLNVHPICCEGWSSRKRLDIGDGEKRDSFS